VTSARTQKLLRARIEKEISPAIRFLSHALRADAIAIETHSLSCDVYRWLAEPSSAIV